MERTSIPKVKRSERPERDADSAEMIQPNSKMIHLHWSLLIKIIWILYPLENSFLFMLLEYDWSFVLVMAYLFMMLTIAL